MRIAMGYDDRNVAMQRAIEGLAQYGEVNKVATEFTRQGIETMRENIELMEKTAREVAETVLESKSVVADVVMGDKQFTPKNNAAAKVKSPFNI
jgi:dihydroneopterin aldolase